MADVLIGYSACQLTREAFERHGHRVWTCDLLPARGPGHRHLQCDIWDALRSREWDLAVLHPMCTYLTVSAAWAYGDGPYHQKVKPGTLVGAARRAARDEAIENVRQLLALPFAVVVENPAPTFLSRAIRQPDQIIQPNQFGDDASKSTGLWLKGPPKLRPTGFCEPRLVCSDGHVFTYGQHRCPECGSERYLPRWANQTNSGQNNLGPSDDRWLERSKTYPGIAAAMGDQWGRWLNGQLVDEPELASNKYHVTDYLLNNYTAVPETGCWLWLGGWDYQGYGKVNKSGKSVTKAHRLFYTHHVGEVPDGLVLCHKCDTPACCNPAHMFVGTQADNIADAKRKGRFNRSKANAADLGARGESE